MKEIHELPLPLFLPDVSFFKTRKRRLDEKNNNIAWSPLRHIEGEEELVESAMPRCLSSAINAGR